MKTPIQRYLVFSSVERAGAVALCCLLVVLIVVKLTNYYATARQVAANEQFARVSAHVSSVQPVPHIELPEHQDKGAGYHTTLPDTVDINAADSMTLVQLVGIGPVTAHNILQQRTKNGPFRSVGELTAVGSFSGETLNILKRHLKFATREDSR